MIRFFINRDINELLRNRFNIFILKKQKKMSLPFINDIRKLIMEFRVFLDNIKFRVVNNIIDIIEKEFLEKV
jgi:hypothetical protein